MSTSTVDTEARLASALRVLLPYAVADEPEWAPERDLLARRVAYNMGFSALLDYDAEHPEGESSQTGSFPPEAAEERTAALALVA